MHPVAASGIRRTLTALVGVFDNAEESSRRPFTEPSIMVPHVASKRYGWTHYGVMIPDLPEPHRFFSAMSLIGATGSLAFDNDHALADQPRRNASVVVGTAASHPAHFGNYAVGRDFVSEPDGSLVRFGDALTISGRYPDYRLTGRFGEVEADLRLTTSDTVTWFVRNPVYKHLSLLTEYRGRFSTASGAHEVSGLCAFEYGACPSPYQLRSAPLPAALKAPLDLFVYQIINLGPDDQVLLSHHCVGGRPLISTALHRRRNGRGHGNGPSLGRVEFRVLEYRQALEATPYGIPMRVPAVTQFTVRDERGIALEVTAELDTGLTYGLGTGFVTGFRHESTWRGERISGRGYMEYIDRRDG